MTDVRIIDVLLCIIYIYIYMYIVVVFFTVVRLLEQIKYHFFYLYRKGNIRGRFGSVLDGSHYITLLPAYKPIN